MFVCLSVCVACVVCIVCIVEGCSLGWTHCWVRVDLPGTAADGIIPSHAPNSLATPLRLLPPSLALLPFPAPSSSPATPAKPAQCSHMMQPHELQLRIAVAQSVQRVIPPQPVDPAHHSGNVLARHRLSSASSHASAPSSPPHQAQHHGGQGTRKGSGCGKTHLAVRLLDRRLCRIGTCGTEDAVVVGRLGLEVLEVELGGGDGNEEADGVEERRLLRVPTLRVQDPIAYRVHNEQAWEEGEYGEVTCRERRTRATRRLVGLQRDGEDDEVKEG